MSWFSLITNETLALSLIYLSHILIPLTQSLPWLLAYWVKNKSGIIPALLALPVFYLAYEIFHYHWDLSYTWIHLGLGFSNSPYFLKLYPYIGQEGGTFYIMLTNMVICLFFLNSWNLKKQVTESIALILLLLIPAFSGKSEQRPGKSKKIGVLQPHIPHDKVTTNTSIDENYEILRSELMRFEVGEMDLVVCPEGFLKNFKDNPIIINDPNRHSTIKKLKKLASERNTAIISGAVVLRLYFTREGPTLTARKKNDSLFYDTYNAVMLIEPDGNIQWRSKVRLVPFAERVPFLKYFSALEVFHLDFNESFGSYDLEGDPRPFEYKDMIIAPLVCYESLYPDVTSLFIKRKANVIMEFSNENWTPGINKGQKQHEDYASVNAMQFGKDYIRSTFNHGSLKHPGFSTDAIALNDENLLQIFEVSLTSSTTFYTKSRSLWTWISLLSIPIIILILFSSKFKA